MRIVLAEERDGQWLPEQNLEGPVVVVGRDSRQCQLVFNLAEWRMVSRVHAEFRWEDGRWLIEDKNSTYGTFIDGNVLKEPAEVREGSRVRFGVEGPVMVVMSVSASTPPDDRHAPLRAFINEPLSAPLEELREEPAEDEIRAVWPAFTAEAISPLIDEPASADGSALRLVGEDGLTADSFSLARQVVRIGRDPKMDVVVSASSVVSRHHAEIRKNGDQFLLADANSFNGTLLNGQRIAHAVGLYHGDQIQLGLHGPVFVFDSPTHMPRAAAVPAPPEPPRDALAPAVDPSPTAAEVEEVAPAPQGGYVLTTYLDRAATLLEMRPLTGADPGTRPPIIHRYFKSNAAASALSVGRAEGNDICLEGLQISARHAIIERLGEEVFVEDNKSTNGVYVNGTRVDRRQLAAGDVVQIGPYVLRADAAQGVQVFDTRANTRVDVLDVSEAVSGGPGRPQIMLLEDVSLSIEPNEFVGLLGPSGAGKSTLLGAMNGMRPAARGRVLINDLDLYGHLDSLKTHIGYVPQEDISHRELTVYRTLYYVAQLRLSRDVSQPEIDDLIDDILDVTELTEQRYVQLARLSGGQRKRVSIAVELVTKPSVIFLDEPAASLDPVNARRIMRLFRNVAEAGRTVIMTTHLMEDVALFHKIGILLRGRLVFYGTPREALEYFQVKRFREIYDQLEAPAVGADGVGRGQASEKHAAELKARFRESEQYCRVTRRYAEDPEAAPAAPQRRRPSLYDQALQWAVLARRYMEVLASDRASLMVMLAQAPVIGLLTALAVKAEASRDFPFFVLALVAMWFGTSAGAREIVKERAVYTRERMVNTRLLPYVGSKLFVLMLLVGAQCVLFYGTLKVLHYLGLTELPGWAVPQLLTLILTGLTGVALGLLISAVSKTSEVATSIVPLVLIPQILFSGLVGVPTGPAKIVGLTMPTTWAFDELKLVSGLPVLRGADAGAKPSDGDAGRGLYEQLEFDNENGQGALNDYEAEARRAVDEYKQRVETYERELQRFREGERNDQPPEPAPLRLKPLPEAGVKLPPKDVSDYVDNLHPWGSPLLNPLVLLAMLSLLTGATLVALKRQDVC